MIHLNTAVQYSKYSIHASKMYMREDVKAREWIVRYSDEALTRAESDERGSTQYKLQVHNNLFLDASDPKQNHFQVLGLVKVKLEYDLFLQKKSTTDIY